MLTKTNRPATLEDGCRPNNSKQNCPKIVPSPSMTRNSKAELQRGAGNWF